MISKWFNFCHVNVGDIAVTIDRVSTIYSYKRQSFYGVESDHCTKYITWEARLKVHNSYGDCSA